MAFRSGPGPASAARRGRRRPQARRPRPCGGRCPSCWRGSGSIGRACRKRQSSGRVSRRGRTGLPQSWHVALEWRGRWACKPSSVPYCHQFTPLAGLPPYGQKGGGHPSSPGVAAGVMQPTRGRVGRSWPPYLALLRVGLARRRVTTVGRELLPPDFTLTPASRSGMFLWRFPSGYPAWALPSTLPVGARTFLSDCSERPPSPPAPVTL